jgi:hypothetical protein
MAWRSCTVAARSAPNTSKHGALYLPRQKLIHDESSNDKQQQQ